MTLIIRRLLLVTIVSLVALPLSAATFDGMKIHSTSSGKGPKTIVLVHGWTCDDTSWAAQVPVLSKHYRVITLDLPGHGRSGSPKDGKFSMDLFARAIEAVRVEQRVDRIVLVGHSMGTPVIRQYARLYPQHVAALVIVDGVVIPPAQSARAAAPPLDLQQLVTPEGLKMREGMIKGMFTPKTPADVQDRVLKMMLAAPPATAAGAMAATFDTATWTDDVMTMPVYGIYAEKSALLGNPAYLKKVFPKIEYVEMPGTGHFVMMEQPQEFNRLLTRFLDSMSY
jgi:pimeloyl-ACP methyl ester carboxylesterase